MAARASSSPMVEHVLHACCGAAGYEAAVLGQFVDGSYVVQATAGITDSLQVTVGAKLPLDRTLSQRMIDGRIGVVVADTHADPELRALVVAWPIMVRSYAGLPVRFPDGRLFGSIDCLHRTPGREPDFVQLGVLADLALLLGRLLYVVHRDERVASERDELLQSVTHDLRTPLQAIRFVGEDLIAGAVDPIAAGNQIEQESIRVSSMVEDIMLVTRHRAGTALVQAATTDLVTLADEALRSARRAASDVGRRIVDELPDRPLLADVDANRILRALQNLLDNAVRYSSPGSDVLLSLQRETTTAVFRVVDTGMGMAPADVERATERFFRADAAVGAGIVGTGLGLTTVQAVAELHEGTLQISSELGAGSTFTLRIPLRRRGVPPQVPLNPPASGPAARA